MVPNITFPIQATFTYTVNESYPVTFFCAASGIPQPEISWTRNWAELSKTTNNRVTLSDPDITMMNDLYEVNRTLNINSTVDADSGTYTCVAENENTQEPTDMQDFELVVQGTHDVSLNFASNFSLTIKVNAYIVLYFGGTTLLLVSPFFQLLLTSLRLQVTLPLYSHRV